MQCINPKFEFDKNLKWFDIIKIVSVFKKEIQNAEGVSLRIGP